MWGPVSSASPNGGGPFWNTVTLLVAGWALVGVWRRYLNRGPNVHVPKFTLMWITAICAIMIAFSIYGFAH
jgi:hypothetical protein